MPVGYLLVSRTQSTSSPVFVRVDAIRLTIVAWLRSGLPRQFMLTNENNWCSILFHLLVPSGEWRTCTTRPVLFANSCNSYFHTLFL